MPAKATGIKTIPMEKKCKNPKWLSGEDLQIAVKRREVKSKGEKERYKHLNAEFQKIARRDKKAFFRDQCKEIEENKRMGKTKDLFKKIRDTKGNISCKDGHNEGQKCHITNLYFWFLLKKTKGPLGHNRLKLGQSFIYMAFT